MYPEWVEKQKRPGTTVKAIGNNYYLYYATSTREKGKKYPVSKQVYIGKITENGVESDRVAIKISETQACVLGELVPEIEEGLKKVIVLHVKGEWVLTKTDREILELLERKGIIKNGKVVFHNI